MANNQNSVVAGESFPPLPKVNSLQALTRLRAKEGSQWCTFAFVLNRDMIKPDGTLDELHAMVFPLGSFADKDKAEEHAKNVIAITGHPGVLAAKYAAAVPLTTKFDPSVVTEVAVDAKGRLMELESAQYKREREEYERRIQQEKDIMKEAEEETNPDSIEHFKRKCYLAIQNRAKYQFHTREAATAWENYKKREMEVRDHYARHPNHEKDWLPYLKEKLIERGEMSLYSSLEAAYTEIRDELLGLVDSDDDDDDTIPSPINVSTLVEVSHPVVTVTPPVVDILTTVDPSPVTLITDTSSPVTLVTDTSCPVILVTDTSSPVTNVTDVPAVIKVDTIECECPGGVCQGEGATVLNKECPGGVCAIPLITDDTSSSSEECSGGVCMAPTTERTAVKEKVAAVKKVVKDKVESVNKAIGNLLQPKGKDENSSEEDDEIIPAEAVITAVVNPVTVPDPGFVEEPTADIDDDAICK